MGSEMCIRDRTYDEAEFFQSKIIDSLDEFKNTSDVIISNRMSAELDNVEEKVFTRDLFGND